MNKLLQKFIYVVLIFLVISGVFAVMLPAEEEENRVTFTEFANDIENGLISSVIVELEDIEITYLSEEIKTTTKEINSSIFESLNNYGVSDEKIKSIIFDIKKNEPSFLESIFPFLGLLLPIVIFIWFFYMIMRQSKGGGAGGQMSFLKAPFKVFDKNGDKIMFSDIAGAEEAKEEIMEIVDFLKNPKKFWKMGAKIPKGALLVGPPGVGKTMLARAVANEADVPFFSMVGSEFVELFVGVGSSRAKSLFDAAKKAQPSIIFIDELDAIGKARMPGMGGGHEEREQTLNQILAEMDGFEKQTGVIVLAATNRPEQLDSALLRPGRFDRRIVFDLPDAKGRRAILKIHTKDKPLATNVKLKEVAERTPGFSGADLANLANEATILAARRNKDKVFQEEMLESIEKVLLGPERRSHLLSVKEKEISAYHEAGHAILGYQQEHAEDVRKISIVSRGMAAGYTLSLPKEERNMKTLEDFKAELAVLLAGRSAEKLIFGEVTTGASNDLERASHIARNIVTKYGMSKLGPISFGEKHSSVFLGYDEEEKNYSDKVAYEIDKEIESIIFEAEEKADDVLLKNKTKLVEVAKELIKKETIEKEEFEKLMK